MAFRKWFKQAIRATSLLAVAAIFAALMNGCRSPHAGPKYDRPFPLGQVTDSFWETQQTNAEAADFIFYDHEFVGHTAHLAPGAKRHLEQVALRLEHVPFPVVIEQSPHAARPELDNARRHVIVEGLIRLGAHNAVDRVVIAPSFAEGFTAIEGASAYYGIFNRSSGGGFAGRGSGRGIGGR